MKIVLFFLAGILAACTATTRENIDWRGVAAASDIVVGTLHVPIAQAMEAAAKGGEHVAITVQIEQSLRGGNTNSLSFVHFVCSPEAVRYPNHPFAKELASLDGKRLLILLQQVEGKLYLAEREGCSLLEANKTHLDELDEMLARHARWLAAPTPVANEKLAREIRLLVEEFVASPERQDEAVRKLLAMGKEAVPGIIAVMDDRRVPSHTYVVFANPPGVFEAARRYSPKQVVDLLAGILNALTYENFGFIYNGASDRERDVCVAGWKIYLHERLAEP